MNMSARMSIFHKFKVAPPLMASTTIVSCTARERIFFSFFSPGFHGLPILSLLLPHKLSQMLPFFFSFFFYPRGTCGEVGVARHGGAG